MTTAERRMKLDDLNGDELLLLYALAGRECDDGCVLAHIGGGIAGPHSEHEAAAHSALAKLSDAILRRQEGGE